MSLVVSSFSDPCARIYNCIMSSSPNRTRRENEHTSSLTLILTSVGAKVMSLHNVRLLRCANEVQSK